MPINNWVFPGINEFLKFKKWFSKNLKRYQKYSTTTIYRKTDHISKPQDLKLLS